MPRFSSCSCRISFRAGEPMCSRISDEHFIYLSATGAYWGQWLYQFSHEYCHHLVNGELTGEILGLKWLEEVLCHTSSLYHFRVLLDQWSNSSDHIQNLNAPVLRDHPDARISSRSPLSHSLDHPGWLADHLISLSEPRYERELYAAIAEKILPLFLQNPRLWKIILHIGDSRQWDSLQELFDHFLEKADPDYIHSLRKLYDLFFL